MLSKESNHLWIEKSIQILNSNNSNILKFNNVERAFKYTVMTF